MRHLKVEQHQVGLEFNEGVHRLTGIGYAFQVAVTRHLEKTLQDLDIALFIIDDENSAGLRVDFLHRKGPGSNAWVLQEPD